MKKNRRDFLKKIGMAGAAATIIPAAALAESKNINYIKRENGLGYNTTINIALIGAGGMGTADMNTALKHEGVKITAILRFVSG